MKPACVLARNWNGNEIDGIMESLCEVLARVHARFHRLRLKLKQENRETHEVLSSFTFSVHCCELQSIHIM